MRFVAVVRALRSVGHDIIAIAEVSPRIGDQEVLRIAHDDNRVLLTEDTDFGELVYAEGLRNTGVILFRFPSGVRGTIAAAALDVVNTIGNKLASSFTVVQPGGIRVDRGNV